MYTNLLIAFLGVAAMVWIGRKYIGDRRSIAWNDQIDEKVISEKKNTMTPDEFNRWIQRKIATYSSTISTIKSYGLGLKKLPELQEKLDLLNRYARR